MRLFVAIMLIISFGGLTVFGLWGMGNHNSQHANFYNSCLGSVSQGTSCPQDNNPVRSLDFHLNSFKVFSTTLLSPLLTSFNLTAMFLIAMLAFFLIAPAKPILISIASGSQNAHQRLFETSQPNFRKLTYWFSLHENSPTITF